MIYEDKNQPKRPWGGFGTLVVIIIAFFVGYYLLLPVGQKVASVFQTLTDAFSNRK